jgi:2-polyprenyl-3-methyl-5-hydroxy-6-metoxy-1,4-benzoquinol methylase
MYQVDFSSADFRRIFEQKWYYSVELAPGLVTQGYDFDNIICTRQLLSRLDPAGKDICDIGTMEGLLPILLKRRGARSVVAIDAADLSERVALVQHCYGQQFEYCPKTSLSRIKDMLSERARLSRYVGQQVIQPGFDVVVLSGVLYHVFSPIHVIGLVRTLLKPGGLLILETAVSCEDRYSMNWVFDGRKYIYWSGTNTWFPTLRFLDHILRYMRLKPIDCVHGQAGDDATRVALAAVAVPDPLPLKAEAEWFLPENMFDYHEVVDVDWARGGPAEIPYSTGQNIFHSELPGVVDLHKSVTKSRPLPADRQKTTFHLHDKM